MSNQIFSITLINGRPKVEINNIPHFTLLGILEAVTFDLKTEGSVLLNEPPQEKQAQPLQVRIVNAQKAIRELGGKVEPFDFNGKTESELQAELDTLKEQYKRLKDNKK
jgi:hypothetical protein